MRPLALLSLASFAALAVVACGTAPYGTEKSASESQGLIIPRCSVGEHLDCSGDGPQGQTLCMCVPSCNFVVGSYTNSSFIESWSVASPTGTCPDVPGRNGTWKDLVPVQYVAWAFDGVPCEIQHPVRTIATCEQSFSGPCCTYVWWPNGFVATSPQVPQSSTPPAVCAEYPQDQYALCQGGKTLYANLAGFCDAPDAGSCGGGGGSSCNTCLRPTGP